MEQDASSSDECTGAAASTTKATATVQLKKQRVPSQSQAAARAGGRELVKENSMSSTSVYTNNLLQDLPQRGLDTRWSYKCRRCRKKSSGPMLKRTPKMKWMKTTYTKVMPRQI